MTTFAEAKRDADARHAARQGGRAADNLTVRDRFAIAALPAMVDILAREGRYTHEAASGSAYDLADAMMRARRP